MAATDELIAGIVSIATAIVGIALVSVIVSKNASTAGVLQAAGSAFGNDLGVAISPVTGSSSALNLSYPSSSFGLPSLSS